MDHTRPPPWSGGAPPWSGGAPPTAGRLRCSAPPEGAVWIDPVLTMRPEKREKRSSRPSQLSSVDRDRSDRSNRLVDRSFQERKKMTYQKKNGEKEQGVSIKVTHFFGGDQKIHMYWEF